MEHGRFVLAIASLFISSGILWALLAAAVIKHFAARAIPLEAPGAAASLIIAALFWLSFTVRKNNDDERRRMRDEYERREAALVKTAAYAAARFRTTEPFPVPPFPAQRPYVVR